MVIIMFVLNAPLALVSLVVMPLTYFLTRFIAKHTRNGFRETQQTLGELNGHHRRERSPASTWSRPSSARKPPSRHFDATNRRLQKVAAARPHLRRLHGPADEHGQQPGPGRHRRLSGGWLAVQGLATVGEIAAFVNYSGRLRWPLNQIAQLFNSIQSALAGAERVFELMDELPEVDAPDAHPPGTHPGRCRLRRG